MRVAVVGAGIAGLALAGGLGRHGVDVHVFERAPEVRASGAGITLAPNGLAALDRLGYGPAVRALQRRQPELAGGLRDPQGRWLMRLPAELTSRSLVLGRAELHRLLLDAVPPGAVHTGSTVVDVAPDAGRLSVDTPHGPLTDEQFDLVVGADGLNSRIRADWPDDPGSRYAGYSAWRGLTPGPFDTGGVGAETWGGHARFGVAPLHDGRVYWFAVHTAPERASHTPQRDRLLDLFGHWHDPIPDVLAATPSEVIQYLPIRELAADLGSFVRGRAVLIGDAAHAMTPNLGQGACQGLEDAATLLALLAQDDAAGRAGTQGLGPILTEYDRTRRRSAQRVARASRRVGAIAHSGGPRLASLRNTIFRLTPDSLLTGSAQHR